MRSSASNILIIIDTSRASGRKFLTGVEKYATAFADWQVLIRPPDYLGEKKHGKNFWFRLEDVDGILVRDAFPALKLLKADKPIVINDTHRELIPGSSTIVTDSQSVGKMAAEYFIGLGFQNFAYCGFERLNWSVKRFCSYSQTLKENGISKIFEYKEDLSAKSQSLKERWKISEWLKRLPHPLCVFACNDDRAICILEACKFTGLNVPEEVAVLGVDNDELMCNLSSPPLSSVELNFERGGFLAAQHLKELIHKKAENKVIYVHPVEIVERRSTDVLAINDPEITAALIFIRNHFYKPIQAVDVVNATGLSRRELEKRFKKFLKKTIKDEIERLRIEWIKKKLINSNQSICQIASELEFTNPEHFSRYFKDATGQRPLQFRRNS